ncbi:hypothetical protein DY000_02002452 [Brassica cretica]|uniref:Dihydrodipicolinate reductase C-terminal domain-containing protein n=1 Tax=Brassica cretica TaxID=69181 RepID=A0ABQ7BXG9_BRACR|nr:hypothetical protein DY000_02002452 [Brassica cretica]
MRIRRMISHWISLQKRQREGNRRTTVDAKGDADVSSELGGDKAARLTTSFSFSEMRVFKLQNNVDLIRYGMEMVNYEYNAELYSKVGVPFVMGTTGGDRNKLYETVEEAKIYAVISPQMGKQVVAFLAAMEIMAEQFPGAFSGYSLEVMESHQASKLDASGTAKAVISCFQELGVSYDMDQIKLIRDPRQQIEMVGVPEEHVSGHAFHLYHLTSPDKTVSFEFQHNVCGRSIYAEGTVDAVLFLAKKIRLKAEQRIYNMIDVLREGNMR